MKAKVMPLPDTPQNRKLYKEVMGKKPAIKDGFILNAYELKNENIKIIK